MNPKMQEAILKELDNPVRLKKLLKDMYVDDNSSQSDRAQALNGLAMLELTNAVSKLKSLSSDK